MKYAHILFLEKLRGAWGSLGVFERFSASEVELKKLEAENASRCRGDGECRV